MTTTETAQHPAKWSEPVLRQIGRLVKDEAARIERPLEVLDPFAGVGLARLRDALGPAAETVTGVDLEPEWAATDVGCIVGDATDLPSDWTGRFDVVATSPTYGNRMADLYDGRDGSRRMTYRLCLGRPPSDGSSAGLQWGEEYRELHVRAIAEWERILRPALPGIEVGGLALLNTSNHVRGGDLQLVTEWFVGTLAQRGWRLLGAVPVPTSRYGMGANRDARDAFEMITAARPPAGAPTLPLS